MLATDSVEQQQDLFQQYKLAERLWHRSLSGRCAAI